MSIPLSLRCNIVTRFDGRHAKCAFYLNFDVRLQRYNSKVNSVLNEFEASLHCTAEQTAERKYYMSYSYQTDEHDLMHNAAIGKTISVCNAMDMKLVNREEDRGALSYRDVLVFEMGFDEAIEDSVRMRFRF